MTNPIDDFKSAMQAAGLTPPDHIEPGKIQCIPGADKGRSNKAGRCFMFPDERGGWFMDYANGGEQINWQATGSKPYTEAERQANNERSKAAKAAYEAEKAKVQAVAATEAEKRFKAATPCTQHPYLTAKGVQSHGLKVEADGTLLVPMRDGKKLWNVERINPLDFKDKRGLPGGRRKGLYHVIGGKPTDTLLIASGYATAASCFEATGLPTVVAFNDGNIPAMAGAMLFKFPDLKIVICADDDVHNAINSGVKYATEAATAVGGFLALPDFGQARPDGATDFNDLAQISGLEAVKRCIENAVLMAPSASDDAVSDWPELQDLISKTEALPYPADALPTSIRTAVLEVAGFVQAPLPLIVQSALAALSLAIQAHYDVRRADKLTGPCSLFLWAIADSGERKSSADGYFTKAIRDYEERQREIAKPLLREYQSALDAWKAQRSGVQEKIKELAKKGQPNHDQVRQLQDLDKSKPIAPLVPRLIYSDATPEGLASSLVHGWPSGGILSNEAGIVLGGHGMGKESAMRNLARLNQLWDGSIPDCTRATTESYGATTARLTMSLQVQEATIRQFFSDTKGLARGTGFLARFLVAWPQSTQGTRFFREAPANWPALAAFNSRLSAILDREAPVDQFGKLTPAMLDLSPSAKELWVKFHDTIETELSANGELADIRDVGSKIADNAARLAALFHVFNGDIGTISADTMESATQIVTWHLLEAKRFLSEIAMPAELANPARLEAWLIDYCKREGVDQVPTREVQQFGPSGIRDKAAIDDAVKELSELGRARLVRDGKRKLIQVRPELLVAAA